MRPRPYSTRGGVKTAQPSRKVWVCTIAAAAVSAACETANWLYFAGRPIPPAVQVALVGLVTAVITGGAGYLTAPFDDEGSSRD
jgi:hypothetical protein